MYDLRSLYQDVIVDHNQNPRNFQALADASSQAKGYNPLCGDEVTVYLKVEDGQIKDASFKGCGCAISTASASLMTESVKETSTEAAETLFNHFHRALTEPVEHDEKILGKLAVLLGVKDYPSRVKCATLAWHAMVAAIHHDATVATTE